MNFELFSVNLFIPCPRAVLILAKNTKGISFLTLFPIRQTHNLSFPFGRNNTNILFLLLL